MSIKPNNITFKLTLLLPITITILVSCSGKSTDKGTEDNTQKTDRKREFTMVAVPQNISEPKDRANYLVTHYWDNFDYSDTAYIHLPEVTEQAFVNYIEILPIAEKDIVSSSLKATLSNAEEENTGKMYNYFKELYAKYLYDPNSPFRNEEFYIPVAEYIVNDKKTETAEKERIRFNLEMSVKNRLGEKAADFVYTLSSGKSGTLYSISASYLILMFYNPDCHACEETISAIKYSSVINKGLKENLVNILAFYPDKDLSIWRKHLNDIPSDWINGYDKDQTVQDKKVYDLKAIPTLYLLDKDKRVLLKDVNIHQIENYLRKTNPIVLGN